MLDKFSKNLTVLFVEDDTAARTSIKMLLDLFFDRVFLAENGKEGLKLFEQNKPDIVITDITMPIMGGIEMSKIIRVRQPSQKIIISSAHQDIEFLLGSLEIGVDGYLIKPIQKKQFIATIKRVLERISLEIENENYQKNLEKMVQIQVAKIKEQSDSIMKQLRTDRLTGLANKEQLEIDFINKSPTEMLFLNIDNFDQINMSYGFEVGDILLLKIAKYLNEEVGEYQLYRLNGDEFAIMIYNKGIAEVEKFANQLKLTIYNKVFIVNDVSIRITVTIGIVPILDIYTDVPYSSAHLVIKEARELRRNSIAVFKFNPSSINKQKEGLEWAQKIKLALDFDLLIPYFQPIVNLQTKEIDKYECLARIIDKGNVISPFFFIESAKIAGILPEITRRIIEKSFAVMEKSKVIFSINISDDDLKEGYLNKFLNEMCSKYHILPQRVVLEILENISNYDAGDAIKQLEELKDKGFQISIDDFGAESSNFARVQKLNVDFIKIDGSFIKDIATDKNSQDIVKTIIFYAQLSGVKTIAEFVHNKETFHIVMALGVDYAQGYHLGEPKSELVD
ncbi:MAG: EAL domain-containing protein [Sulfurimonas sp.]|nr:EAL domain-containing protein [Sulfurimonas sp.]